MGFSAVEKFINNLTSQNNARRRGCEEARVRGQTRFFGYDAVIVFYRAGDYSHLVYKT